MLKGDKNTINIDDVYAEAVIWYKLVIKVIRAKAQGVAFMWEGKAV